MKPHPIILMFLLSLSIPSVFAQKDPTNFESDKAKMVEMEIKTINTYYEGSYVIDLTKKGGTESWVLPVVIGDCETRAIVRYQEKITSTRPLTYDLILTLLETFKAQLEYVAITKLEEGTFYAILALKKDDGTFLEIDARPSDSINIALKAAKPIYATQTVIDQAKEVR